MKLVRNPYEWLAMCATLSWGAIVWNPYVDTFSINGEFFHIQRMLTEYQWGEIVCAIGLLQFMGCLFTSWKFARRTGCLCALFVWILLALLSLTGNPHGVEYALYAGHAGLSFLNFVRLKKDC